MKKILIIEDDSHLVSLLEIHLKKLPYEVMVAKDGISGIEAAFSGDIDLIILDIMIPGMDGLEVCKRIRAEGINTSILMLSAKSEEIDKVLGLETGADDYLTKPFGIREFLARIKVILKRRDHSEEANPQNQVGLLRYGDLEINIDKKRVAIGGLRVDLTPREFELLVLLASNPGKSYNRKRLLNLIWGYDFEGYEHTVNSHINRLRSKIESDMSKPVYIITSWGLGYRFNEEL